MAAAAENLVLILLDVTDRTAWGPERQKYGVTGLPTILYLDPDGNVVGKLSDRSPQGVAKQFGEIFEKYGRTVPWVESVDDALKTGAKEGNPVLLFCADDGKDSELVESFFVDPELGDLAGKFVLVRHEVEKKCDVCKRFRARGGQVQILDGTQEAPEKHPLYRISGKKKVEDFRKSLEIALKRWERAREK